MVSNLLFSKQVQSLTVTSCGACCQGTHLDSREVVDIQEAVWRVDKEKQVSKHTHLFQETRLLVKTVTNTKEDDEKLGKFSSDHNEDTKHQVFLTTLVRHAMSLNVESLRMLRCRLDSGRSERYSLAVMFPAWVCSGDYQKL